MKKLIFIAILTFAFFLSIFAQANEKEIASSKSSTLLIAEFNDDDNEWYKIIAENINQILSNDSSTTALIRIKYDSDRKLARRLASIKFGLSINRVELNRITFLIVDKQQHDTEVLIASSCSGLPQCEDCIVIRAIDIAKLNIRSKPKPITKKSKK